MKSFKRCYNNAAQTAQRAVKGRFGNVVSDDSFILVACFPFLCFRFFSFFFATKRKRNEVTKVNGGNRLRFSTPYFASPSRGMSEAKVEQQSTETLSFRCWCEQCRLSRGRIDKQKRTVGWAFSPTT